jgi:hypothetical protein
MQVVEKAPWFNWHEHAMQYSAVAALDMQGLLHAELDTEAAAPLKLTDVDCCYVHLLQTAKHARSQADVLFWQHCFAGTAAASTAAAAAAVAAAGSCSASANRYLRVHLSHLRQSCRLLQRKPCPSNQECRCG